MRDPTGEEESVIGLGQVFWFETKMAEEVAAMVKRHDDHHQAAQDVDGINAAKAGNFGTHGGWDCRQG